MFFDSVFVFHVDASVRATISLLMDSSRKSLMLYFLSKLVCERLCHVASTDWLWFEFRNPFSFFCASVFNFLMLKLSRENHCLIFVLIGSRLESPCFYFDIFLVEVSVEAIISLSFDWFWFDFRNPFSIFFDYFLNFKLVWYRFSCSILTDHRLFEFRKVVFPSILLFFLRWS